MRSIGVGTVSLFALLLIAGSGCEDYSAKYYALTIEGNGYEIESPHRYPDAVVGTHFETVAIGQSDSHSFRLTNHTGQEIEFTADPAVMIMNDRWDQFSLLTNLTETLQDNTYIEFSVGFTPTRLGEQVAIMVIPYRRAGSTANPRALYINLAGIGETPSSLSVSVSNLPDLRLYGANGTPVVNGDVVPTAGAGTDFGDVPVGGERTAVFRIENAGPLGTLELNGTPTIAVTGLDADEFFVTVQPGSTVLAPGDVVSFGLTFSPTVAADRTAIVVVSSDDPEDGSFMFLVRGTGTASG